MCFFYKVYMRRLGAVIMALLLWIVILPISLVAAATADVAELVPLSVDDLSQRLISRNAALSAVQLRAMATQQLVLSAGALDDPRLSYAVAPASFGDRIPSKLGNAVGMRQIFQFSQSIPWPGKRALQSDQMQASAAVAQFSVEALRLNLLNRGRTLWAQWWYVHQALGVNAQYSSLLSQLRDTAEIQYTNGVGRQQDLLTLQTRELQLQHRQIVLSQQRRRTQSQINQLLNQAAITQLGPPLGEPRIPQLPARVQLEQWLLQSHPKLLGQQAASNVARLKQRLTEQQDYPDLQFNLGYNELWNESSQRLQVGLSLNIPLNFGKRTARKAAAEYEYRSSRADIENTRSELMSALESQLSQLNQASHSIELLEGDMLAKLQQGIAATLTDYQNGGGEFTALIDAQEKLLELQLQLSSAYAEQFIAMSEIDKLSGGQMWPHGEIK